MIPIIPRSGNYLEDMYDDRLQSEQEQQIEEKEDEE